MTEDEKFLEEQLIYIARQVRKSTASDAAMIIIAKNNASALGTDTKETSTEMAFDMSRALAMSASLFISQISDNKIRLIIEYDGKREYVEDFFKFTERTFGGRN